MKKTPKHKLRGRTILLCLSGSIAIYRSCDLIRDLKEEGADVICVMTRSAREFISPLTFQALSGNPVHADPYSTQGDWAVLHTTLADRADLILACPASANLIARLAQGMADDLVTSIALASRTKILLVPAMNDNMYTHPITQENIRKLKAIGYRFCEPVEGELVCGRKGLGHIAGNPTILQSVVSLLIGK